MSLMRARRDHGVRLGEPRPVGGQRGLRRQPARRYVVAAHRSPLLSSRPRGGRRRPTGTPRSQVSRTTPDEPPAGVRRHGVAVLQPGDVDGELLVRREHAPGRRRRRPRSGPCARSPTRSAGRRAPSTAPRRRARGRARRRRGPHRGQRRAGPRRCRPRPAPKSPAPAALSVGRARRVVGDHEVDVARGQAGPQRLAVAGLADRRAALELGGAVGHVLGVEGQVVRAGLDRQRRRPSARARAQHRAGRRRCDRCTTCARPPVRAGLRRSPARSAAVLGRARPGGQEPGVRRARRRRRSSIRRASSACTIISAPSRAISSIAAANSAGVQGRELGDARSRAGST